METIIREKDGYSLVRIENVRYGINTKRFEVRSANGYVYGLSGCDERRAKNIFDRQYDEEKFLQKK